MFGTSENGEDVVYIGQAHIKKNGNKAFGVGMITAIEGTSIAVEFDKAGSKKMGYEFCMEKKMLEFI